DLGLRWGVGGRGGRGVVPHVQQRQVAGQHLGRERVCLAQLLRPPAVGTPVCGRRRDHPLFSRVTRNAFNSGAPALAAPTDRGSALASQCCPVLIPTKRQWIGMPIWYTFLPSICSGPSRFVTTARISSLPRFDETRTWSPVAIPFSWASSAGISTNASG